MRSFNIPILALSAFGLVMVGMGGMMYATSSSIDDVGKFAAGTVLFLCGVILLASAGVATAIVGQLQRMRPTDIVSPGGRTGTDTFGEPRLRPCHGLRLVGSVGA